VYTVILLSIADLLVVILLTEGAMHPSKVQQIRAGWTPPRSLGMLRDVAGSRDHLRIGRYDAVQWGDFAAQVSITASDGTLLAGTWEIPRLGATKAVILCHGFGDSSINTSAYFSLLLGNGFAVLAPDSRGHGRSQGINTFGVREADDIVQWIRAIKSLSAISKIYGLGESLGGAILLQSLERGADFRAVVAESPFASFFEVANESLSEYFGPVLGRLLVHQSFLYARLVHRVDLNEARPARSVAHSLVPILLIHGESDEVTQPEHSREIARENPAIQLWFVPSAQHTLSYFVAPLEFGPRVIAWLDR
jgi:alpha-beta hydrolase superfamily lysophospholipase